MLSGLEPLPPLDRMRDVLAALGSYVGRSELKPGDRLPAEREMMRALAVGRSTIREAIRQLQALGIVETRKGSGSYLLRPISASTVHMPLSFDSGSLRHSLQQTLEVRRALEVEASMLAAKRASAREIAMIGERLEEMERVHHAEGTAGTADLAFHLSIYAATGNPMFEQLLEQMRGAFERFFAKPFDRPDFAARSFPFHRELFDAIAAGDPDRARQTTLSILAIVEEDIEDMST